MFPVESCSFMLAFAVAVSWRSSRGWCGTLYFYRISRLKSSSHRKLAMRACQLFSCYAFFEYKVRFSLLKPTELG